MLPNPVEKHDFAEMINYRELLELDVQSYIVDSLKLDKEHCKATFGDYCTDIQITSVDTSHTDYVIIQCSLNTTAGYADAILNVPVTVYVDALKQYASTHNISFNDKKYNRIKKTIGN